MFVYTIDDILCAVVLVVVGVVYLVRVIMAAWSDIKPRKETESDDDKEGK